MPNMCLFIRYLLCTNHCACSEDKDTKALRTQITCSVHLTYVVENRIQNHYYVLFKQGKTGIRLESGKGDGKDTVFESLKVATVNH